MKNAIKNNDWIKATEIWVQNIICRDITKRQFKILGLIHLLCIHNKRMECRIPTLTSFEVTGVSRHKIRSEIEKLEKINIVSWDREKMIFKINVDIDTWKVPFSETYKPSKLETLFTLNDGIHYFD